LVRLPAGPGAPKGVDDYLVAQGPQKLSKLVKKAKPFKPRKTKVKPDYQPHPIRPAIQVNNRQLLEITTDALAALRTANQTPRIFVRNSQLVWIARSEQGVPQINPLGENELRNLLGSAADWVSQNIIGQLTPTLTPIAIVRSVMGLGEWSFPPLRGLTSVPVLRPDGTILSTPGYDPATQLYFTPLPGAVLPSVPTDPSQDQAKEAARYLLDDLLVDFPFVDQPSRANALAAMVTPVLRPAIAGSVPLALVNAPKAGTGKSLLAEIFGWVSTGQQTTLTSPPQAKNEDPEWQKIITAALLQGVPVICFDNLEGTLRSPALSLAITATRYSARILHQSYAPELPVRVTWYATGNNVQLGGDLPRRVYWITLDPKCSRPWERNGFRHDPLRSWVDANRGKLLGCLLTMARA
ncbi:MAG: hypothetical protein PHW74_14975, partial [Desulfobacca sp.]|nr:hypothetical protein [Desulfobacca sp.]